MTAVVTSAAVGPLELPRTGTGPRITDPVVDVILDFLGWKLSHDLNANLAYFAGTSVEACPASNRFPYNPFEPRGHYGKRPLPALYLWWDGTSEPYQPTIVLKGRARTLRMLYVFQELSSKQGMEERAGLFASIEASIVEGAAWDGHPSYGYDTKTAGTPVSESVGAFASWDWSYLGGEAVQRVGTDSEDRPERAGRDFPGFAAMFRTRELVQPSYSAAHTTDSPVTHKHNGVDILDRTLEPSDGTDAQP